MKRLTMLVVMVTALIAPMALSGCEDSACPTAKTQAALETMGKIATDYGNLGPQIKDGMTTDEYDSLLAEANGLEGQAKAIDAPQCLADIKAEMVATIDSFNQAVTALKNNDTDTAQAKLDEANQHFDTLQKLLDAFSKAHQ